jgi:hypothetical protein
MSNELYTIIIIASWLIVILVIANLCKDYSDMIKTEKKYKEMQK